MLHNAMSKGSMDWHKYPKSRVSIRIRQPETLDSIKCHTFPELGGKTLDILWPYLPVQLFFAPNVWIENVWIEMPAHTNSFIVIPALLVHALARQSDLHKFKSTWRLAEGCFRPTSLTLTGGLQGYWPGPAYPPILFGPSLSSLSQQDVNCTATNHLSSRELFLHRAWVLCHIFTSKASESGRCFWVTIGLCFILLRLCPATSWLGRGGGLVQRQTYVANLQVGQWKYIPHIWDTKHQSC